MSSEAKTKTTSVFTKPEFWMTLVTSVSGLLLAFGVITPEQSKGIETHVPNIIGAILSLLSTFKFVNVQHAAKVEVFRAMCAMTMEQAERAKAGKGDGVATAQGVSSVDEEVAKLARAAGI